MWSALFVVLLARGCLGRSVTRPTKDDWEYIGCYKDTRPRDLTSYHKDVSHVTGMSLERCYEFCTGFNNLYMALQDGNQCRCDNGYGRYGKRDDSDCDEPCTRDSSQICGGGWRNSVYKIRGEMATKITEKMMKMKSESNKLVFSALGDWGREGSGQRAVAKQLGIWSDKHQSAFTAAIGDNFYNFGVPSVDDKRFKTTWKDVYTHKSLQHPWLVIEGNHDYLMGNAPYQVMYGKTDSRWVMPSLYYSMHYTVGQQDVHLIFIDTDPIKNKNEYHQFKWFKKEIGESKADWIIVIGHHNIVSSGYHGGESSTAPMYDNIRSEMVKHKAALYICGHEHFLEHLLDNSGVVDYVISGSGAKLSSGKSSTGTKNIKKKNVPSKFFKLEYGFVGFELEGKTIRVSYIDKDGREIYSFSKVNPRASGSTNSVIG